MCLKYDICQFFLINLRYPNYFLMNCNNCYSKEKCHIKFLTADQLFEINRQKEEFIFSKGDLLFDEGEMLNGIFCIQNGIGKLSKLSTNGKDQIIKLVVDGEFIGRRSVFTNERSSLKATAVSDMSVCFIPKDVFLSQVTKNVIFSNALLKNFAEQLIDADNSIVSLGQKSVSQRMASILLYLKKQVGLDADGAIKIQLSRSDYANIIGTATESVIRVLSDFNKKGLISIIGKSIRIKNHAGLKNCI